LLVWLAGSLYRKPRIKPPAPGIKKSIGETLRDALMPLQPVQNGIMAAESASNESF